MPLPKWLARANRVGLNRVMRHVTPHVPGFGVVHHVGRRSGTRYSTPVNVFARPGGYTLSLTYGADAQWARNVLAAGSATITTRGRDHRVTNPRLVVDPSPKPVPAAVARILSWLKVDTFLFVDHDGGAEDGPAA